MLLFAHLGVTLGATVIAVGVRERFKTERLNGAHEDLGNKSGATDRFRAVYRAIGFWFESLGRLVDIRAIFIGSLLPDIIDKPIGHWLLADSLNNGRIFSHSFLFFLVTLIVGLFLYRRYTSTFVLAVSFGVMMHLILDSMWLDTHTLLWPFLGVTFEQGLPTDDNFIVVLLRSLRQMPYLLFEIVGFLIVCAFGFWLVKKGVIIRFIRSGKVNQSM
jgi:membrane-bound metal-dependent hydrolase YbcI (DUF457 family)